MAIDQFVAEAVAYISDIKVFRLGAHLGVEDHMEQHVAEFLAYLVHVVPRDSGGQLERLLDCVLPQAVEGLFAVPGTFLPKVVHNVQQPPESL